MLNKVADSVSRVTRVIAVDYKSTHLQKMVMSKAWYLKHHFKGEPTIEDFDCKTEELPELKDGEILCVAEWLSVDPYMRPYSNRRDVPNIMIGSQVAKVIESKNANIKVGKYIFGYLGWRTHTIIDMNSPDPEISSFGKPTVLPDFGGLSPSLSLGVLGMPGNTAYFGFLEICKPKMGETVVVSGAAGAVGSHVGQIAKIKGCKVIGFAGSDEKVKWLKDELKFDAAFNYKNTDLSTALKEAAPDGVDCYFDNVGGKFSSTVLEHMNLWGRISVCGCISAYNADSANQPLAPIVQNSMIFKQLKMEGFLVFRWSDRFGEAFKENLKWIQEGKLKYKEHVTEGFENMPQAFMGMLRGENIGKAIVKA